MAHSIDDYGQLLKNLLPPGLAFRRETGTNLEQLLLGAAVEFARVEGRADTLVDEGLPFTTAELLPDWERVTGLPDKCAGTLEETLQGRRNAVVAKLASTGGQSVAYFEEVAARLGFTITINEFRPFRAGMSAAGDPLTNGDWVFAWRVDAPAVTVIDFRAGLSAAGEALRTWGNDSLECKLRQLAPAHTVVIFAYGD